MVAETQTQVPWLLFSQEEGCPTLSKEAQPPKASWDQITFLQDFLIPKWKPGTTWIPPSPRQLTLLTKGFGCIGGACTVSAHTVPHCLRCFQYRQNTLDHLASWLGAANKLRARDKNTKNKICSIWQWMVYNKILKLRYNIKECTLKLLIFVSTLHLLNHVLHSSCTL